MDGIIEQLKNANSMYSFIDFIGKTGIENKLNEEGPFTVFAPNDEAFEEIPESTIKELTTNLPGLEEILNYHIVKGDISGEDLESIPILETLQGDDLLVETDENTTTVNDAIIIKKDIEYSGGRVHIIDSVLMP
jgi:uncharacterized surface protein with fasciclin (FAS1) repeats